MGRTGIYTGFVGGTRWKETTLKTGRRWEYTIKIDVKYMRMQDVN
jgi:hypothetical protein